jgi:hypothetical protein
LVAAVVRIVNGYLAGGTIYCNIHRNLKRGTFLYEVVAQKPEGAALRKNRSFLLSRTIFEVKYKTCSHALAANNLRQVTVGDGVAIRRP